MKINVATLPPEGLKVKEKLSLERLNARMDEGRGNDIRFTAAPLTELIVRDAAGGISVNGSLVGSYGHPCPRCVEVIPRKISEKVELFFKRRDGDADEDDIGLSYFDGIHIDLEESLQEILILAINPFEYLPSFCEGRNCEQNQEDEQQSESSGTFSLMDKLKDAGIK